ncbi:hypothetical protein [Aquimarina sp. 2201CG5-10]|uniref:hypothetical protein n=1 Tax=Aquimarina callyspongiae TaxID=3098150 RepID=UPI002AB3E414|nr:hypothetical protein [Aquimarina sp. 2201CG5-10]MDY8137685.1 hypothetical protein [Aquimarina sp. 2201CG5-10]
MRLSEKQTRFLVISNISCWILLLSMVFISFTTKEKNEEFDIITAKRINIVNDDGTIVMAISNKQQIAAPRMNGKEYPVDMIERQHFAGMIFFNENGDEMGGLIFNSNRLPDGRKYGSGHLSFDRFNDNQVINLEHQENIHGKIKSGITFYDRKGDGSFGKNLDLLHEYKYADISKSRKKEIIDEIRSMKKNGDLGTERVFLGSYNEIPQLTMKDNLGNERIKLFIDSSNIARLNFYNDKGVLLDKFPK